MSNSSFLKFCRAGFEGTVVISIHCSLKNFSSDSSCYVAVISQIIFARFMLL